MLCWLNNLHMLSLSNLYHNDELNNQAWMRDWQSLSCLKLDCSVNNTGLVDWLILVCWSSREEVTIVVFHARRAPWMLTQHSFSCAPLNVGWTYKWMATFSTFGAMSRWLHFWESVVKMFNFLSLQELTCNLWTIWSMRTGNKQIVSIRPCCWFQVPNSSKEVIYRHWTW